jgi:hypothetical protein
MGTVILLCLATSKSRLHIVLKHTDTAEQLLPLPSFPSIKLNSYVLLKLEVEITLMLVDQCPQTRFACGPKLGGKRSNTNYRASSPSFVHTAYA